jgi:hypothetical protein
LPFGTIVIILIIWGLVQPLTLFRVCPCLQSTAALPFGTIVIILIIWGLVTIPLTVAGGIAGKNNRADFAAPCRTNKYPREIPELPWYRWVVCALATVQLQAALCTT